eukprot:Sdes_comp20220_c0_seq1m13597
MIVNENELLSTFKQIGYDFHQDQECLSLCVNICTMFELTPSDLSAKWDSFTLNHPDIKNISKTSLERFKKEIQTRLEKNPKKYASAKGKNALSSTDKENSPNFVYDIDSISLFSNHSISSPNQNQRASLKRNLLETPQNSKSKNSLDSKFSSPINQQSPCLPRFPETPYSKRTN